MELTFIELRTIIRQGGATLNKDLKRVELDAGYMVGVEGEIYDLADPFLEFKVITKAAEYAYLSKEDQYIGFWKNKGRLYLDKVLMVADLDEAKALGKAKDQKAIWDNKNKEEINL
jgi:hypothetical protein